MPVVLFKKNMDQGTHGINPQIISHLVMQIIHLEELESYIARII